MKTKISTTGLCIALTCSLLTSEAFSWGARGHDLIARVAVRLLAQKQDAAKFASPLVHREQMIGTIANMPDTQWRNLSPEMSKAGNPTHFLNIEKIISHPSFANITTDTDELYAETVKMCNETGFKSGHAICGKIQTKAVFFEELGSSPWRAEQFFNLMQEGFNKLASGPEKEKEGIHDVALYGGLLAHFVGDMTQPLHNTDDYDCKKGGRPGCHSYFETALVSAMGLDLDAKVLDYATKEKPFSKILADLPPTQAKKKDVVVWSFALVFDSFSNLQKINDLDNQYAVLHNPADHHRAFIPTNDLNCTHHGHEETPAASENPHNNFTNSNTHNSHSHHNNFTKRRKPAEALPYFSDLLIERLAVGADALAEYWYLAWLNQGQPDISAVPEYYDDFIHRAAFVMPSYYQ